MNDDLHKTFEPEPVRDDAATPRPAGDAWEMPKPVFRRSAGRVSGAGSSETMAAPTTIASERPRANAADPPDVSKPPPIDVEPQPDIADPLEADDAGRFPVQDASTAPSRLSFGIVAVAVIALLGIFSALAVAVYLGYIVWR